MQTVKSGSESDETAEGGSYLGGSGGMLLQKIFTNKEQNIAIWGYLGGFDYI